MRHLSESADRREVCFSVLFRYQWQRVLYKILSADDDYVDVGVCRVDFGNDLCFDGNFVYLMEFLVV